MSTWMSTEHVLWLKSFKQIWTLYVFCSVTYVLVEVDFVRQFYLYGFETSFEINSDAVKKKRSAVTEFLKSAHAPFLL